MRLIVTGGLGFIGSNFILQTLEKYPKFKIVNIDAQLTGSNKKNLPRAPPSLKKYLHSNQKRMKVDESQDEINIQFCQSKGADAWFDLSKWMKEKDWGVGKQRSQCFNMGKTLSGKRKPSSALSYACKKVWDSMEQNYGWDK